MFSPGDHNVSIIEASHARKFTSRCRRLCLHLHLKGLITEQPRILEQSRGYRPQLEGEQIVLQLQILEAVGDQGTIGELV